MARGRVVYEGKAKIMREGREPGTLVQHFKDDLTAFEGRKHGVLSGKGVINNRISEYLMLRLEEMGLPTHFVRSLSMRDQLVRRLEMVPIEVVLRNIAAGSLCKRLGLEHGKVLGRPLVEFYLKNDELGDPLVTEDHIAAFGWLASHELEEIMALALRVNDFLSGLFLGVGIRLVDMKMEFGRFGEEDNTRLLIGDEISPDTCRLWRIGDNMCLDKDRFRKDMGSVIESYGYVAEKLGLIKESDHVARQGNRPFLVSSKDE